MVVTSLESTSARLAAATAPPAPARAGRQAATPIPFNRSSPVGNELRYLHAAVNSGKLAGDHGFSRRCQQFLEHELQARRVLLTTSCTHALEMAALLLDLQPGDEVIVPAFTFVSTANAFALRGAQPVFCDIRPDTLNLDERILPRLITPRTRAIVPVHYAGVACEMDAIIACAASGGIAVIEDNAHGLFGRYQGRWLGTLGTFGTQSFHETKNLSCGEGGALLINDPAFAERAEIVREKGTNRSRFFRGQVDKYSWVDLGSSYVMSDLLAAFLLGQLERWRTIQRRRERLWLRYHGALEPWTRSADVQRPFVPAHCTPAWHLYHLLMPSLEARTRFIAHLRQQDILAVFHYVPLHLSEFAARWGGRPGDCPVTEDISDRLVRLPFFTAMTDAEQDRVVAAITSFTP